MKITAYGHPLDLTPPDGDEIVTDVMVIARAVRYDHDGGAHDAILTTITKQTPGMIQTGMLSFAMDSMHKATQ